MVLSCTSCSNKQFVQKLYNKCCLLYYYVIIMLGIFCDLLLQGRRKCSWSSTHFFWGLLPQHSPGAFHSNNYPSPSQTCQKTEKRQHSFLPLDELVLLHLQHNRNRTGGIILTKMCLPYNIPILLPTLLGYSLTGISHTPLLSCSSYFLIKLQLRVSAKTQTCIQSTSSRSAWRHHGVQ